ncbi:peptidoglycan recognition family protein [Bacillus sp. AFS040349]|uniref:peptidoglycan recognition protein family protein n=1 Tax=Bacillus sp. AFS040349 TaxID=2033502 RepID=UPI000BFDCF0A|nr:peptidoglycan recognition family protein [Bacillus sp. AFS040349]PGT89231.1 hypothetical protein COD11_04325 [Bacillus sp. AFS040349]
MYIENLGLNFKYALTPLKRVNKIIVHHPAHPTWDINDIHKSHQGKGWNGIGYNYFVTKDGRAQLGRGHNVGAHCKGNSMNDKSLGVSFQGNFEIEHPTEAQYRKGAELIAQLIKEESLTINDVDPHKKYDATVCPGKNFDLGKLKQYILEILNPTKGVVQVVNRPLTDREKKIQAEAKELGITDGKNPLEPVDRFYLWSAMIPLAKRVRELEITIAQFKK